MGGWTAHPATLLTIRTNAVATPARRSTLPLASRRLRVVVSLVPADIAHDIVMGTVKLIAIAGDVLGVLDEAVVNLRQPLVHPSHTLQLLFEK